MITSIHFSLPWILKILNGSRLPLPLKTEKVSIIIINFAFCCTSSVSYRLYSAAYSSDRHLDNCIKFSIDERLFACYTPIIAEANFCFRKEVFTMRMLKPEYFVKLEEYINDYQQKRGYSPSISDMVRDLGIPQTTVYRYLTHMKENGMLEINGRGKIITKGMAKTRRDTIKLPVLGAVSCGIPKYAEENIEEYVQVPASWFGSGAFFALRADGQSMINAGIDDGDLVIIRKQEHAEPGQIVVALINNEDATLKRYRPRGNGQYIDLVPENDKFKVRTVDLSCETLVIQGVAVKVLKDLE